MIGIGICFILKETKQGTILTQSYSSQTTQQKYFSQSKKILLTKQKDSPHKATFHKLLNPQVWSQKNIYINIFFKQLYVSGYTLWRHFCWFFLQNCQKSKNFSITMWPFWMVLKKSSCLPRKIEFILNYATYKLNLNLPFLISYERNINIKVSSKHHAPLTHYLPY